MASSMNLKTQLTGVHGNVEGVGGQGKINGMRWRHLLVGIVADVDVQILHGALEL